MTLNMEIRQHDLEPSLVVDLTYDGGLLPLDMATDVFVMGRMNGVLLFKRPATAYEDGTVIYSWQSGDTELPGTVTVEVEVIWAGNRPQTVRAENVVRIYPDLG